MLTQARLRGKTVHRLNLRLPEDTYNDIVMEAERRHLSLNAEMLRRLKRKHWQNQANYQISKESELQRKRQRRGEQDEARTQIDVLPGSQPF